MGKTHVNDILDDSSYSIKERVEFRVRELNKVKEEKESNLNKKK